jgi:hypothetical protein
MFLQKILVLSLAVWLFAHSTIAQTPPKTSETKPDEISAELKGDASKLLNSVGREAQQFALPENRIQTHIIVGDLLWENDEKAARAMFEHALGELQNLLNELAATPGEELSTSQQTELYSKKYAFSELRKQYVLTLAPRDPHAALAALRTLKTEPSGEEYDPMNEAALQLQLAASIAKKDPEKAYALAKQQLNEGLSYQFFETLKDLYKTDAELAVKLSKDALAKIKSATIRPTDAQGVSPKPLDADAKPVKLELDFWQVTSFLSTVSELNRQAERGKDKKTPVFSEAEMKELTNLIAQAFLAEKSPAYHFIGSAMQDITRYARAQAVMIRRKIGAEAARQLDSIAESTSYYSEKNDKTSDELLAEAEKVAPDARDPRLSDAIYKAIEEENPEKAQTIAAKIKDRKSYQYLFEMIDSALPLAKAKKGDLPEVRKILATLKTNEERAATLSELAAALAGKGDREAATKLLEEAAPMLSSRLKKQEQLQSYLQVARAYSLAAPDRAFAMLENGAAQMNDFINAGIMLDEFYSYGSQKQDELIYNAINRQALTHVENSVELLKNLAKADFARTVDLADKFARPEIRVFVRLKLAQALLDAQAAEREKKEREQMHSEHDH